MPSIDPARDSGFLVTPGDVGALREAVSQLLDHDVSLRLGEGAFEMWEERYSPDRAIASRSSQSRGQ